MNREKIIWQEKSRIVNIFPKIEIIVPLVFPLLIIYWLGLDIIFWYSVFIFNNFLVILLSFNNLVEVKKTIYQFNSDSVIIRGLKNKLERLDLKEIFKIEITSKNFLWTFNFYGNKHRNNQTYLSFQNIKAYLELFCFLKKRFIEMGHQFKIIRNEESICIETDLLQ